MDFIVHIPVLYNLDFPGAQKQAGKDFFVVFFGSVLEPMRKLLRLMLEENVRNSGPDMKLFRVVLAGWN